MFRELMKRAPVAAWLAIQRTPAVGLGSTRFVARRSATRGRCRFELVLVNPIARRIEPLRKVRGGARSWRDLDTVVSFVDAQLEATGTKGHLDVYVI
jgi:hypothetical protein